MKLYECILTKNDCYKSGRTIQPRGVMIHSTGANNPKVSRYVGPDDGILGENPYGNHWNNSGISACVHGFIGKVADGTIATYQTLPWSHRGWHCGTGTSGSSANNTHISFEICEDNLTDGDYFALVYQESVELTAYLCQLYDLDPLADGVVICHAEGYDRGIASNHGDVNHWFPKFGKTMSDFRQDVYGQMQASQQEANQTEKIEEVEEEETLTQSQFDTMMDSWLAERSGLEPSDWAVTELDEAKAAAITDGTRPQAFATRQEVAIMLVRAIKS